MASNSPAATSDALLRAFRLVATVPDDELSKAREVVATVERRGEEARAEAAEKQAKEAEALRYLLSG